MPLVFAMICLKDETTPRFAAVQWYRASLAGHHHTSQDGRHVWQSKNTTNPAVINAEFTL